MVGTAESFLQYNTIGVHKHLLALEDHLRNLSPRYESEEASCLFKHAIQLEEQSDEGISHASEVDDRGKVAIFKDLQVGAKRLRERLRKKVNPGSLIRDVRRLRKRAEALDPAFNLEKCRGCGSAEDLLGELKGMGGRDRHEGGLMVVDRRGLRELEADVANRVLERMSARYGVEPPRLEISDSCHEPDEGYYVNDGDKIVMCRGGVNLHVLLHEFKHYYDHTVGKPLDEDAAEAFAIETVEKGLYSSIAKHNHSERKMDSTTKDVALIVGGVNLGWGIGYAAKAFLDPMAPGAILGQDPSLLVDVGGTIAGIVGALRLRGAAARKLSAYVAAGLSTHIWEDLTKVLAPTAMAMNRVPAAFGASLGVRPVGEMIPGIPAMPYPAPRLAEYPFPSPVSIGGTMSPPHYTLNGVPGAPRTVSLAPKYTLDTF